MKQTFTTYLIGFILSIALTLLAFFIVMDPGAFHMGYGTIIPTIIILAIVQLLVQLVFFMHLANETGPRWNLWILLFTIGIILIVVIGSIWIMNHLNYNMMANPSQMNAYIQSQDGL